MTQNTPLTGCASWKSLGSSLLAALFSLLVLTGSGQAEMVDRVVAVVNDEIITLSELDEEAEGIFQQIASSVPSEQVPDAIRQAREDILNTLIDKKLIAQKAKAQNISVSEAEIDEAMERILTRTGMSREALLGKLTEQGVTEQVYRTTLESQILQNKLVSTDIHQKIIVTDDMILDYYDENYTSQMEEGAYYLLQIGFMPKSDGASSGSMEETRKRAERVYNLAKSGQDFRTLAQKFSDLPSSTDGGDIGTFQLDEMAAFMKDAIASLKAGELSDIIQTPTGYQFYKVVSVGENAIVTKAPYESVKEEIRRQLYDQELKKAYEAWVKDLKAEAYIQKL